MPKHILIVDDDQAILEVTRIVLQNEGFHVSTASNYDLLDKIISTEPPHIILLDVTMPGRSGKEIAKKLKSDSKTQNIPVIIVSAKTDIEEIAKEAGADAYLEKPFEIEELIGIVEKHT